MTKQNKVKFVDVSKMSKNAKKRFAIDEIVATPVKSVSNSKLYKELAKTTGLSVNALKHAYENFSNFGKVDLRYDRANANTAKAVLNIAWSAKTIAKRKKVAGFKQLYLKPAVIGQLIHEYYFSWKGRTIDFLNRGNAYGLKVNPHQWYGWLRELAISGKITGWREVAEGGTKIVKTRKGVHQYRKATKTVLDYRKYGKGYLKAALKIARATIKRNTPDAKLFANKVFAGFTKADIKNAQKTCHILDMYL